ncbi:hypothetical protein GCM10011521_16430 [Arenimonas soli]|uniref:Uncharacterized protein n=1 Tax=Arenimonas soli TaxID=2269504 RepID=A0ABQ1HJ99_9GAMM|nr:hypothetical protein GCM10011521_16430 [Arenimonas soli]
MHKTTIALLLFTAGGCASTPGRLCDHDGQGLSVLTSAPPEAPDLLATLRARFPSAVDDQKVSSVWLRSADGDLYLCTYNKGPAPTGTCGATVHQFVRTESGYVGGDVSISACH